MRGRVKLCKEDGCKRPVNAKGLCKLHYSRLRYLQLIMKGKAKSKPSKPPQKPKKRPLCKDDSCERDAIAKGLCLRHWRQARKPPRLGQSTEKKRKKINPVSSKRRAWNEKYYAQVERDAEMQAPVDKPHLLYGKDNSYKIQRHHPFRRMGEAILAYCYLTTAHHTWVEDHGRESRELGWIHDKDPDGTEKRPWPESVEILHNWPEKYRRKENMKTENIENKEAMTMVEGGVR